MPDEASLPPPPPPVSPGDPAFPHAPSAPPRVDGAQLRGLRSLSTAVMVLVALVAFVDFASVPNEIAYASTLQDVVDGGFPDISKIEDQEDLRGTLGAAYLVVLVIAAITWVVWQQRARSCAEALGAGGQRHTKPLAIFGWVIPIAGLFIPKQVTDDLWRASDPDAPPAMRVEGRPVWGVINAWWALWVLGGIIGQFIFRAGDLDDVGDLEPYIGRVRIGIGATFLEVVSAVLAILIVQRITGRLIEHATRAGIAV